MFVKCWLIRKTQCNKARTVVMVAIMTALVLMYIQLNTKGHLPSMEHLHSSTFSEKDILNMKTPFLNPKLQTWQFTNPRNNSVLINETIPEKNTSYSTSVDAIFTHMEASDGKVTNSKLVPTSTIGQSVTTQSSTTTIGALPSTESVSTTQSTITTTNITLTSTTTTSTTTVNQTTTSSKSQVPDHLHELIAKFQHNLEHQLEIQLPMEDDLSETRNPPKNVYKEKAANPEADKELKKILIWNDFYGDRSFLFGLGHDPFIQWGCPVNACLITADRQRYPVQDVDAVVFHFRSGDHKLPKKRSPHTRFVFWMNESPQHLYGDLKKFKGAFNWTFTYRNESDLYNPYGFVHRKKQSIAPHPPDYNYATNKTKMAAWFVSNCEATSERQKLVKTMQKYLTIDIYGGCGTFKCQQVTIGHQHDSCLNLLEKDYKFYLSFENSLCEEYITEKFFDAIKYDVVPVVYGLGNYQDHVPHHSYINVFDFPNVKTLTDYLIYLDLNDTAYNEYFEWKTHFRSGDGWPPGARPWCRMCELLNTDNTNKIYEDMNEWFVTRSKCQSPAKFRSFNSGS